MPRGFALQNSIGGGFGYTPTSADVVRAGDEVMGSEPSARTAAVVPGLVELVRPPNVATALADAELASEIYSTSGDYDLIAKFYVEDEVDIGRFVNGSIHAIDGIERTLTTLTFKAF